jgi:hypothetical protein
MEGAPSLHGTCDNLHRLAGSLKRWSIESFGAVQKKICKLEGKLKDLRLYNSDMSKVWMWRKSFVNYLNMRRSWLGDDLEWTGSARET